MTHEFDHFLLTRFSAVFRSGDVPAQEEWLRYRLGFFVDACWASVRPDLSTMQNLSLRHHLTRAGG